MKGLMFWAEMPGSHRMKIAALIAAGGSVIVPSISSAAVQHNKSVNHSMPGSIVEWTRTIPKAGHTLPN